MLSCLIEWVRLVGLKSTILSYITRHTSRQLQRGVCIYMFLVIPVILICRLCMQIFAEHG